MYVRRIEIKNELLFFLGIILKSCACVHYSASAHQGSAAAAAVPVRFKNCDFFKIFVFSNFQYGKH